MFNYEFQSFGVFLYCWRMCDLFIFCVISRRPPINIYIFVCQTNSFCVYFQVNKKIIILPIFFKNITFCVLIMSFCFSKDCISISMNIKMSVSAPMRLLSFLKNALHRILQITYIFWQCLYPKREFSRRRQPILCTWIVKYIFCERLVRKFSLCCVHSNICPAIKKSFTNEYSNFE